MENIPIKYKLSFDDALHHYVDVEMEVKSKDEECRVGMAVWTPGSYLVREFGKNIDKIEAFSNGETIRIRKVTKNEWIVYNNGEDFVIKYKIYAFKQNVRESFISDERATINGPTIFMYAKGMKNNRLLIEINPNKNWKKIDTDLRPIGENIYVANDFEDLMDSVMEIGNHKRIEFEVLNKKHVITMVGEGNYDLNRIADDCSKIVESAYSIFGELPYTTYNFMLQTTSDNSYGGLEHKTGALMTFPAFSFVSDKGYLRGITLISHEYFHLWNVKRIYPEGLSSFIWNSENYTDLLWVAEGFTSYYESFILLRAGIIDDKKFMETILDKISRYKKTPGRLVQSVAHSSWDAWIKFYRQDEHSVNTVISYYLKGALIAFMLDIKIREGSKNSRSIDDLMRMLYKDSKEEGYSGYTFKKIREYSEIISELNLEEFFETYVYGTDDIKFEDYFKIIGYSLVEKRDKVEIPYFGVTTKKEIEGKYPQVSRVLAGFSAYNAGIYYGDIIIAINGARVTEADILDRIKDHKVGEKLTFTLFRNNFIKNIEITGEKKPACKFVIEDNPEDKKVTYPLV